MSDLESSSGVGSDYSPPRLTLKKLWPVQHIKKIWSCILGSVGFNVFSLIREKILPNLKNYLIFNTFNLSLQSSSHIVIDASRLAHLTSNIVLVVLGLWRTWFSQGTWTGPHRTLQRWTDVSEASPLYNNRHIFVVL